MSLIGYNLKSGAAFVTLNSPANQNALSRELVRELHDALDRALADDQCRVIVLDAEGPAFCSGMDFSAVAGAGLDSVKDRANEFLACLLRIVTSRKAVAAKVDGAVAGGGLGVVGACDLVLASPDATFIMPEVIVGMFPALIAPFLMRRMSAAQIRFMAISTQRLSAADAARFGLVDHVMSGPLDAAMKSQIQRILRSSPAAIAETKQYLDVLHGDDLRRNSELALQQLMSWLMTPGVSSALSDYAAGLAPPWFEKYEP
jgi:enoyl-CoA hydratase/carnithine racemase